MMKYDQVKHSTERIRNLLIKDELKQALADTINFVSNKSEYKEEYDTTIILNGRFENIKLSEVRGTVTFDEKIVEYNKIRNSILNVIDSIEGKINEVQIKQYESIINNIEFPDTEIISNRESAPKAPDNLLEAIMKGKVIPMIGAGLSIAAIKQDTSNPVMPTYQELLIKLYKKAEALGGISQSRLLSIKEAIDEGETNFAARELKHLIGKGGLEFQRILSDILDAAEQENLSPSLGHKFLKILGFNHIITTNYDRILENLVCPKHKVITPQDESAFHLFTESLMYQDGRKYLLKMHGDITRPDTIFFGEDEIREMYLNENRKFDNFQHFINDIFTKKTILFLGYSFKPESEGYTKLFSNFLKNYKSKAPQRHYALVPKDEKLRNYRKELSDSLNIVFLEYEPDEKHTQVGEFISYLNTTKTDDPIEGKVWSQWYLPNQRDQYLERQLFFEKKARSVRYLTPTLTNALSTELYLTLVAYKELVNAMLIPGDNQKNIDYIQKQVMPLMFERKLHLDLGLLSHRLEVRIMFLQSALEKDFENIDDLSLKRYEYLLNIMDKNDVDLEVRLLPNLTLADLKQEGATFALILGAFPKPNVDVALAYASQANINYFNIHMIEVNTATAQEKIFQFERYWASALGEQETKSIIKSLFEKSKNINET